MLANIGLLFVCAVSFKLTRAKGTEKVGEYYFRDPRYQNKLPSNGDLPITHNTGRMSAHQCGVFCQGFPGCLAFIVYNGSCVGYDKLFVDQTYKATTHEEGVEYYEVSGVSGNLALGKPTGSTSVYKYLYTWQNGDQVVNGRRGGSVENEFESIFHTTNDGDKYMWVDLQQRYFISLIKITNRINCCWDRFQGVSVSVGDTLETLHECWFFTGPPETAYVFVIRCGKVGRFVKIQKQAYGYFNFAGLEVSGYDVL